MPPSHQRLIERALKAAENMRERGITCSACEDMEMIDQALALLKAQKDPVAYMGEDSRPPLITAQEHKGLSELGRASWPHPLYGVDFSSRPHKRDRVDCPICKEPDMRREWFSPDDGPYISCTNIACPSNDIEAPTTKDPLDSIIDVVDGTLGTKGSDISLELRNALRNIEIGDRAFKQTAPPNPTAPSDFHKKGGSR